MSHPSIDPCRPEPQVSGVYAMGRLTGAIDSSATKSTVGDCGACSHHPVVRRPSQGDFVGASRDVPLRYISIEPGQEPWICGDGDLARLEWRKFHPLEPEQPHSPVTGRRREVELGDVGA